MTCEETRSLLHAYLDDELDAAGSLDIARHLEGCAGCAQRFQTLARLHEQLRSAGLYSAAPASLHARMLFRLPQSARVPRSPRGRWSVALAALAALFVLAAVLAGWQALQLRRQAGSALVADAVSDHVRSLLPGHLIDVRSTDQHTVKPWFDGRVGFSPQVRDLSAQGFELVGGRLDVLDGKQVAALVYRRHLHLINVFQWPGSAVAESSAHSRDGYGVVEWRDDGLCFIAVSSVAARDLQDFVRAFRAEAAVAREPTH